MTTNGGMTEGDWEQLISADPDENAGSRSTRATVARSDFERRFDIALYFNGMPVSVIELKRAGSR